jgi:hypothetical protein
MPADQRLPDVKAAEQRVSSSGSESREANANDRASWGLSSRLRPAGSEVTYASVAPPSTGPVVPFGSTRVPF